MLTVSIYRHPDEIPGDVQQLFAAGATHNIEHSTAWYANLIDSVYPGDDGIHIYVLKNNGMPVAALPLRATMATLGQQVQSLSNYYTALYAPLITPGLESSDLAVLLAAVHDAHAPLASVRLAPMDPESAGFGLLMNALKTVGLVPFKFFCFGNWYLPVKEDWPAYLQNRNGTVRSTLKRMGKKFAAVGGKLELVQGGDELERGVAAYLQVYASSWKTPEPFPQFVPNLIRTCAAHGWLRLGIAWLNGEPVAVQLWIVANGKASIYKLAHDEKFKTYASGTLLTSMLMAHVMQHDQVTEVDYLMGDDPYKQLWMNQRRERWGIIAYNPKTLPGLLGLGKEVLGRRLKGALSLKSWIAGW
ncbi:MAG: GNAT family N-acetyltransferase [Rhodoferax sp.]|uniref:GNAT family N-acetyltransferase n=1 Tax=Rhodoferax sp. TaxID=50421 RepID=UPI00261E2C5A|nr:GNAT family N-acetyltransferase [Rhodoferax sp.]MDD2881483.1 GNAT family N-acetyltransferase [Rhodoferax sp.]